MRRIPAVKSPKKPSGDPPAPSQDEYRRFNVLQEQLLSKFQTFGEAQSHMLERLDRMEPQLDHISQKVDLLESAVRTNGKSISALKDAIHGYAEATGTNSETIQSMQAEFKKINHRIEIVEARIA